MLKQVAIFLLLLDLVEINICLLTQKESYLKLLPVTLSVNFMPVYMPV